MESNIFDEVNKEARKRAITELKQEFLESENYTALDILKTKFHIKSGERRCRKNGI